MDYRTSYPYSALLLRLLSVAALLAGPQTLLRAESLTEAGSAVAASSIHELRDQLRTGEKITLDSIPGKLILKQSQSAEVRVEYKGLEPDEISLQRDAGGLVIRGRAAPSITNTSGDGRSQVNIRTSGGAHVVVNGKEIDPGREGDTAEVEVTISVPSGADVVFRSSMHGEATVPLREVEVQLSGISELVLGEVEKAKVDLGGTSSLVVKNLAKAVDAKISGVGKLLLEHVSQGDVSAELSGSSNLRAAGEFNSLQIKTTASARANTEGTVSGDAVFRASGASRIEHKGDVQGRTERDRSGAARISLGS